MVRMAKSPKGGAGKRKRYHIFITLDEETEKRLQAFLDRHRVRPDRAAVAYTALLEFLDKVEKTGPGLH